MLRIDEIYCYVAQDDEGEGIAAFSTPNGWMPLVGADKERIESLKGEAQVIATLTGKRLRLVRFTTRTELEVIEP